MRIRMRSLLLAFLLASPGAAPAHATLAVVTTVPDLADLARQVGGPDVDVTALVRGPQDPHFVQARPSFVRQLHDADVFVRVGLDLEIGWAPVLLRSARNPDIQQGGPGDVDASRAIAPLDVPTGGFDRSMGDVHPYGNPHYLLDPLNGLRVARLLRDRFAALDPAHADGYAQRCRAFEARLLTALVGADAVARFDADALVAAVDDGRLEPLLGAPPGGWLGAMAPYAGTQVVQDHRVFPYFTRRFGLVPVIELEPKPGIAPTTSHTTEVIERVRADGIPLILASPYFDPRHARRVAEQTGATVVVLAHQVGALDGTDDYLTMIGHDVDAVREALAR